MITRHSDPSPPAGWNDLVSKWGTFYHDARWITAIARCFRYRVHWLTASESGAPLGGMAVSYTHLTLPTIYSV